MWPDLGAIRDGIIFNILNMAGGILWTLDRIMMMVSAILNWFRVLLVGGGGQDNLLGILMTQLLQGNELLKQLVYLGIMLAFTVLAFTLIARPLIGRFQAVEFNRVILWFFIAVIIFSAGPGMMAGLESTRLGLQEQAHLIASTIQYQNELNRYNNQVVPNTVGDFWLPGQIPGHVPHLFGTGVGSNCPSGCNGLDAAAAFLAAEEGDITGARADAQNTGGYPQALYDRYFTWRDGNEEERSASVRNAKDGVMRLLEGTMPAFFSILEAAIFLLFGIGALVLFVSLPVAIPFAFFSLTEVIAASVLRAYLFLVLRTFVVATMMAFLVQMLIIFAERGTALVFIAISALTMLLSFQFVGMAASTVTGALNVIGSAVGSATGTSVRQSDPLAAAGRVVGMAALAGAAAATGGGALVGAASLLHRQGGIRGGGLSAVGSAALHAARVRAASAAGRTPLAGFQRGYSAVQSYHTMAREHAYQMETSRSLQLDRDAGEAAAILIEKRNVPAQRKEWARKKVSEWRAAEGGRLKYRADMRAAGLGRLAWRGNSRPWKATLANDGTDLSKPYARSTAGISSGPVAVRAVERSNARHEETAQPETPASTDGTDPGTHSDTYSGTGTPNKGHRNGQGSESASEQQASLTGTGTGAGAGTGAGTGTGRGNGVQSASIKGASGISSTERSLSLSPSPPRDVSDSSREPHIVTMLRFKGNDLGVRAMAGEALMVENMAVAVIDGYLVVYGGVYPEDDPNIGRYDLVPDSADILDLLQRGKHVQKSAKRPGFLLACDADQGRVLSGSNALTPWSGVDARAGQQALSDVRDLANRLGSGLSLNSSALQNRLSHLSLDDRQRLLGLLQDRALSREGILHVLAATCEVADSYAGVDDAQVVLDNFIGPDGYLDLASPGVSTVVSLAQSRGVDVRIQPPGSHDNERSQGVPASDMALLISAGLGLKRTLPWTQVKGAIVAASLSDDADPIQSVSEGLGVASLRTSMAPIKRFVETARNLGFSPTDLSTTLDVAASVRDMGEVIAAIPEKDEASRHARWHAAGVPGNMLQALDRVRSNALGRSYMLSPDGIAGHRAREQSEEVLGSLLAEGMTISAELYSLPIETYSGHPFTVGGANTTNTTVSDSVASNLGPYKAMPSPGAVSDDIEVPGGANETNQ